MLEGGWSLVMLEGGGSLVMLEGGWSLVMLEGGWSLVMLEGGSPHARSTTRSPAHVAAADARPGLVGVAVDGLSLAAGA